MSYFIINEGWKRWAHGFNKFMVSGIFGYKILANTKLYNPVHKAMDGRFFNHLFNINKIQNKIYEFCSKIAKPLEKSEEAILDKKGFERNYNYNKNNHLDSLLKFNIIKKIFNNKHNKFYLIRFTFDDKKIYNAEIIIPTDIDNNKAKLINIKQWKFVKPEEYINK